MMIFLWFESLHSWKEFTILETHVAQGCGHHCPGEMVCGQELPRGPGKPVRVDSVHQDIAGTYGIWHIKTSFDNSGMSLYFGIKFSLLGGSQLFRLNVIIMSTMHYSLITCTTICFCINDFYNTDQYDNKNSSTFYGHSFIWFLAVCKTSKNHPYIYLLLKRIRLLIVNPENQCEIVIERQTDWHKIMEMKHVSIIMEIKAHYYYM
mgnify:CR=1 FL=1